MSQEANLLWNRTIFGHWLSGTLDPGIDSEVIEKSVRSAVALGIKVFQNPEKYSPEYFGADQALIAKFVDFSTRTDVMIRLKTARRGFHGWVFQIRVKLAEYKLQPTDVLSSEDELQGLERSWSDDLTKARQLLQECLDFPKRLRAFEHHCDRAGVNLPDTGEDVEDLALCEVVSDLFDMRESEPDVLTAICMVLAFANDKDRFRED